MVRCKEAGGSQGPFLFMTLIFFQLQSDLTAKARGIGLAHPLFIFISLTYHVWPN